MSVVDLDSNTCSKLRAFLSALNLRMGIFDLKVTDDGPVWLEVNPQGRFLFLEGITRVDVKKSFAKFLVDVATASS